MLVLTRKKNESIVINGDIEIVIVEIGDGKVKLGIKAPKNIEVHRKEIYEAIQKENRKAANMQSIDFKVLKGILKK
ncbi:carbon storage regulator [Caloranaerobacter azorensis H53214]|uniref:Translational regulator CsrA n=2 Tax=Caloranaerobacter azorensis TaxID=116090 RepID=A0A1M5V3S3_9FIRM|nr:carbon storage regulator CsrA [Caloranaerobacter azorensis]KGG79983.1 carbon storage regulator [Caloranaerobacter azorensis H53214]SHH69820.1 carbon storage regulator, CsrA [Caloranaerobacter azorensis DSM 13643]